MNAVVIWVLVVLWPTGPIFVTEHASVDECRAAARVAIVEYDMTEAPLVCAETRGI